MPNSSNNKKIDNAIKRNVRKQTRKTAKKAWKKAPIACIVILLLCAALYLGVCFIDYCNVPLNINIDTQILGVDFEMNGLDVKLGDEEYYFSDYNLLFSAFPKTFDFDAPPMPADGEAIFHFIDVGQGDAILITTKSGNILVDTSERDAKDQLDAYLKATDIKTLDYLVLTHPDSDHIGNAEYIIKNYDVKTVVMSSYVGTTKTYERVLDAIEEKKCNVLIGEAGNSFVLDSLRCIFIGPVEEYKDSNEMSLVIKAVFGDTSVMLTGDAEEGSEEDILKKWNNETLKCDILKVGHHGSTSSTTEVFLEAVDPQIAVISCGTGNSYGHPHTETIEKLTKKGITIHRTDLEGTIVYKTDGKTFSPVVNE